VNNGIFFTGDAPDDVSTSAASRMVQQSRAVRLAPTVYTTNLTRTPESIVNGEWIFIVGRLFPGSTVTDRSAKSSGPVSGVLFLAHDARDRELELPGLTVLARRGAPPLPDDIPLPGGLHLASRSRGMVENAAPSRTSKRRAVPRRLKLDELAEWVDQVCQSDGEEALNVIRDRGRELAPLLGVSESSFEEFNNMVSAALSTNDSVRVPHILNARRSGRPFDQHSVDRFDVLTMALRASAPQSRRSNRGMYLPFYEAYFSNFIEGTEFTVEDASRIVFEGFIPPQRSADAHDILGTYKVVNDEAEMRRVPRSVDEFIELMRSRHRSVLELRSDKGPGEFKVQQNRAGNTLFVAPELVIGTLTEGFGRIEELETPWERAVMTMFVVSETHPFADGNGRIARVMMNAELVASDESRIIIPTGYRADYIGALRRLSRDDEPSVYIKAMRYAQNWTYGVDFSDMARAEVEMMALNAFEEDGPPLRLPGTVVAEIALEADSYEDLGTYGWVAPYIRKDGTRVRAHRRKPRG